MGNNCCSANCSSENEIATDLGRLEEIVQDITHLDLLISIVDQSLQSIPSKNNRDQQKTSTKQVGNSSEFGSYTNFGKDLVVKMLKSDLVVTMMKRADRNRVGSKPGYDRETRKVVSEVLKGASQIQQLAAGVCVVGYLIDEIEQLSDNRNHCVQLLRCLCALARRVKQLDSHIPAERHKLDEAVNLIFGGCVLCLTQMESQRLYRLFQASVDAGDLQKLESQIRNTYTDFTLGAVDGVLDNTPFFLPPTQGQDPQPVGRELAKDRVIRLLKMDPTDDSKRAVVIYGFGGIGKTTLASSVLKTLDLKAYKYCRVDMDENCSNDDIKQLQEQMLQELFGQRNVVLNSYVQGQKQLTEAFKEEGGRVFMFIDNALESNNLAKLLPTDLSCLPSGMRILLTTRKLDQTDMLSQTGFLRIPYEVDLLSPSESKKLLSTIALGSANASLPTGIENTDVEEIVNMCGGIPLVIELIGHKFKKHLSRASEVKSLKEFFMESVAVSGDVGRVVDEVYKSLDDLSKEAFLDIVCFFDKRPTKEVSVAVGKVQLKVLQDAALVKLCIDDDDKQVHSFLWGTEEETPQFYLERHRRVKVHDMIKARGRWLSQQDRILELKSLQDALQDGQLQNIKGIGISGSAVSDEFEIKAESLNLMHSSLRVLRLPKSIKVNGICHYSFESLKYLEIQGNLPIHPKQLKGLSVLKGADSENVDELPASLHFLSLRNSAKIPALLQSFDNLSSLEYLDLEGCNALVKVPTSFGLLQSLTELDLSTCSNLTALPQNIENLSALQFLNLSHCHKLGSLPPTFGQLKSLLFLNMAECRAFTLLPDSFGNLSSLQFLSLAECKELVALPKNFGNLCGLKLLNLSGCSNLESLPESFGQLTCLKSLFMDTCEYLKSLPDNFGELKSLKFLTIKACNNLKTLNGGFRYLSSLMALRASDCESLDEEAVDILVEIKSLLFLEMDGSPSLIQRWEQIGQSYPLIVSGIGIDDDYEFLHTVEHTLFHGGSRFVGVEGDSEQLIDWSWSRFAGEEEEEVEVSVLLTMCDLSLDCNNNALQVVRKELERRMEENHGRRKFQIVYVEAGDSLDKSEQHIRQTVLKLLPSCTCACMPTDNRTRQLFAFALYSLLEPESRYAIQGLHTCIFRLRVEMQRDRKWVDFQSGCFPNDYKEALRDQEGGFERLFSTLDLIYK
ncbi:disease resistance protein RPV1 isoform X3 [Cryptomeria japonica]|uniref:disease resistance protein RPV1 isoform X3 n=1 Tax=Cryptomeria japonica TaxID=3369 RepID=UPI0027DA3C19|nr:disease resistance protein RPV1 isoform X3 [Cryptomeria japonica]